MIQSDSESQIELELIFIMPQYCAVPGCFDTGGFKFPKDEQLRLKWRVAIKREGPRKGGLWMPEDFARVCPKHFKSDDFKIPIKSIIDVGGKTRRDLKAGTVPSVFPHVAREARQSQSADERGRRLEKRRQQVFN